jgi:hypothetical protein
MLLSQQSSYSSVLLRKISIILVSFVKKVNSLLRKLLFLQGCFANNPDATPWSSLLLLRKNSTKAGFARDCASLPLASLSDAQCFLKLFKYLFGINIFIAI